MLKSFLTASVLDERDVGSFSLITPMIIFISILWSAPKHQPLYVVNNVLPVDYFIGSCYTVFSG